MERAEPPAVSHDLDVLLRAIEQTALRLYDRHGLPTTSGHYRSPASEEAWTPLGAQLSADERWTMIQESPEGQWRYASLETIGARSEHPDVRQASAILSACAGLRQRLDGRPPTPQDLADSIRLGAAWRTLDQI